MVKLTAGKFYTNEILVDGFDGCFEGAGMDSTVVDTLRGLAQGLQGVELVMAPTTSGLSPAGRASSPSCGVTCASPT